MKGRQQPRFCDLESASPTNDRHHVTQSMEIIEDFQVFRCFEHLDHLTNVVLSDRGERGVNVAAGNELKTVSSLHLTKQIRPFSPGQR
jgi:hypothetical protein